MDIYTLVFIVMIAYVWAPTLMTQWYKFLWEPKIYLANLIFAFLCIGILLLTYSNDLNFKQKGGLLMLLSPLCFLVLFKMLDRGAMKLYKRHFVVTNRFTLQPKEQYKTYDLIGFLILIILPLLIPLFIREL